MSEDLKRFPSFGSLNSIGFSAPSTLKEEDEMPFFPPGINWRFQALSEVTDLSYKKHTDLLDYHQVALVCSNHGRVAIQLINDQLCSLPCVPIPSGGRSQNNIVSSVVEKIIPKKARKDTIISAKLQYQQFVRVQHPRTNRWYQRQTTYHWIEMKNSKCCQNTDEYLWVNFEQLQGGLDIDCLENAAIVMRDDQALCVLNHLNSTFTIETPFNELDIRSMISFTTDPDCQTRNLLEFLFITEKTILNLLNEFIVHCWPSTNMSFAQFCQFIAKLFPAGNYDLDRVKRIFNSFNPDHLYSLDFSDIVNGFFLMDDGVCQVGKNSPYYQYIYDHRMSSLFRFINTNRNDYIVPDDIVALLKDYYENLDPLPKKQFVRISTDDKRRDFLNDWVEANPQRKLTFAEFKKFLETELKEMIEKLNKNSPEILFTAFRNRFDLAKQIEQLFDYSAPSKKVESKRFEFYKPQTAKCESCNDQKYRLSDAKIRIDMQGKVIGLYRMGINIPFNQAYNLRKSMFSDLPESQPIRFAFDMILRLKNYAHQIFKFSGVRQADDSMKKWGFATKNDQLKAVQLIINWTKDILAKEKRVVAVKSPTFVFGDIHGNLRDLSYFYESGLIAKTSFFCTNRAVFLGDFVDRGDWGIEVVLLLFCMKIVSPENIFLIRGNHETRTVQHEFGFMVECRNNLGLEYWQYFNHAFDVMPIAAMIDDKIYCAHGGIPTRGTTIEQLLKAPSPLANPVIESNEAWDALWNDPINDTEVAQLPEAHQAMIQATGGFCHNTNRGTAYRYSYEATSKFLKRNNLEYVIRAHEPFLAGYKYFLRGITISVFSSSNYIGIGNCAGTVAVMDNKIRPIQLDKYYKADSPNAHLQIG